MNAAASLCIERTNDVVVASASDMTDVHAAELVEELIGCLRYDNVHYFVLDLGRVEHINAAGLQALQDLHQELELVRGRVVIADANPAVESVFASTRLDELFELFDDVEDAVGRVTPV